MSDTTYFRPGAAGNQLLDPDQFAMARLWATYSQLDPASKEMFRRRLFEEPTTAGNVPAIEGTSAPSIRRLDALDHLLKEAIEEVDLQPVETFAIGEPMPEHVPQEWLDQLRSTNPQDQAPFELSWDED